MKVADVKLRWTKSPSADVAGIEVVVTKDGTTMVTAGGPEVQELMIVVEASKSVQFKVITTDSEGLVTESATYSFTLGDLEAPQPATGLAHEIVAVRDVEG